MAITKASIRAKGQNFERKMSKLFNEHFGLSCERNLQQSINGGDDLLGVPFFSIELKKHNTKSIGTWWRQCQESARRQDKMPVLIYELARAKPTIVMRADDVRAVFGDDTRRLPIASTRIYSGLVEMTWDQYCQVYRFYVAPGVSA